MPNPLTSIRRRLAAFVGPTPAGIGDGRAALSGPLAPDRADLLERVAWTLVWLGVLVGGVNLWGAWWSWPVIDALAPALVALSFVGFVLCWCGPSPGAWWHQGLGMAGALAAVTAPEVISIHTRIYYPTDSSALDHVAARVLTLGHNPYTASLTAAARFLKNPELFWTYTVTGGHVSGVSYPAGSFLVYAPAFLLGFRHQVVDWMDLYAWLATALLLFFLVPRSLRWLAALITLTGIFTGIFGGGGTDATFLPFALLALWRWDRYGKGKGAGVAGWLGPIALGLACAIKQTPWFLLPFLVIGIFIETRRDGRAPIPVVVRYVVVTVFVFLAVNLPFIVMGASAWWHGTILPFNEPLVADGQGLVSLALHGLTGGVDLRLLMYASLVAYLATLVAFVAWFGALKRLWMLLVPVSFFFAPRSFTGYLLDMFPLALIGLVTVGAAAAGAERRRWGRVAVTSLSAGVLGVATAVLSGLSFTGAPLALRFLSADIGPGDQHVFAITLAVTNQTGRTLRPEFMVDTGAAHPAGFWTTSHNEPVVVRPHSTVGVTIYPPPGTLIYLPPWAADYVVDAYTADPSRLSTTNDIWHNYVPMQAPPRV